MIAPNRHVFHVADGDAGLLRELRDGAVLVEGEPETITRDSRVIEAYLGKKWAAHAQH